ncbi:MAG TPA: VOC family protein [Bryobacteraceae bacterium]|nr:VOC family protein [Bryobacteraceae bacterium]
MINAVHTVIYTKEAEKVHAFFRDTLGFPAVDAGHGWLIFGLPPAELGVHPIDSATDEGRHQLYLMCDDIRATMRELESKGVEFTQPVSEQPWGLLTAMRMPGGAELHLYEPRHPSPLANQAASRSR